MSQSIREIKVPSHLENEANALFDDIRGYAKDLREYCEVTIGTLQAYKYEDLDDF